MKKYQTYAILFKIDVNILSKYQLGHNNEEELASGHWELRSPAESEGNELHCRATPRRGLS